MVGVDEHPERGERSWSTILEALEIGTWHWDRASGVLRWSTAFARCHGLHEDSREGPPETLHAAIFADDRGGWSELLAAAGAGRTDARLRYRVVLPGARTRTLEARATVAGSTVAGVCFSVAPVTPDELRRTMATACHDLRNPLNTIKMAVTLLRQHAGEGGEAARRLDAIERAVTRADAVARGLVDVGMGAEPAPPDGP